MKKRLMALGVLLLLLSMLTVPALAEQTISTTVVMRVSQMTQNAVVNEGEDLTMEVTVDGVTPDSYQWYFNGEAIVDGTQKAYSIRNAKPEDSGVYRMDAFDESGKLLVSIEISARVIAKDAPKTGDTSLPVQGVIAVMALAGATLLLTARRKKAA